MLINYIHLLIFYLLINLSTCNWLRIGLPDIDLPDQDYIEKFNIKHQSFRNSRHQFKKMHPSNDTHQHRFNNKLNNLTILTKFLPNDSNDIFFNDFTKLDKIRKYEHYDSILNQFNDVQLKFIKKNPNSLNILSSGANLAIKQCALRFEKEKWNCSIEDENDIFGQTLKRANKESAFIQSIVSAATVYSFTKACSTGNLANCDCEYKYEKFSDIELNKDQNQRNWYWAGCSDNLDFGIKLTKQFLNTESLKTTKTIVAKNRPPSLREYMNSHNTNVGINSLKKLMRLKCRCHGASGSCQIRTCWKVLPKFNEISKYLKKKYRKSVHIEGIINQGTNLKLKRSRRDLTTSNLSIKNHLKRTKDNMQMNSKTKLDTNKMKSIYYNELSDIELNSNSFIVNKINQANEKEIDEDEDYDEEEDYIENNKNEKNFKIELEKNKLINKNEFFDNNKNRNQILLNNKASLVNKQQKIINKQFNEIDLEIENLIPNVHKPLDRIATTKPNIRLNQSNQKSSSQNLNQKEHSDKQTKLKISKSKTNNQSSKWFTPNKSDLIFIHKSPNYCTANSEMNILGTHNRTCRNLNNKDNSDSCELLCCGRGYNRKMLRKTERCNCEFDIVSVEVKCKTCQYTVESNTCK